MGKRRRMHTLDEHDSERHGYLAGIAITKSVGALDMAALMGCACISDEAALSIITEAVAALNAEYANERDALERDHRN